jgi:hypothetical protein
MGPNWPELAVGPKSCRIINFLINTVANIVQFNQIFLTLQHTTAKIKSNVADSEKLPYSIVV